MKRTEALAQRDFPKAFIFDFDGTLCDVRSILQYIDRHDPHLTAFHEATHTAPPNEIVFEILRKVIAAGITPILISVRGERWRSVTVDWLTFREFEPEIFYMRADDDMRSGPEVKRDILRALRREWEIVGAVDDDPKVYEMWLSEDVRAMLVPGYNGTDDPNGMIIPEWWEEIAGLSISQ